AYQNLASVLTVHKKDFESAQIFYAKALIIDPVNAELLFANANLLRTLKDELGAINAYQDLLKLYPNHVEARSNLGALYLQSEQTESAIKELQIAVATTTKFLNARKNHAAAWQRKRDLAKAAQLIKEGLTIMPDNG